MKFHHRLLLHVIFIQYKRSRRLGNSNLIPQESTPSTPHDKANIFFISLLLQRQSRKRMARPAIVAAAVCKRTEVVTGHLCLQ